jgi:alkaline phosphatase D
MAQLASLAAFADAYSGAVAAQPSWYPFRLGVASGSPRPTSIVLWTRLVEAPLAMQPIAPVPLAVGWEIAHDDAFKRIAAQGMATALPELGHSVHVDVEGLEPGRWYWYRFMMGDAVSPTGRTRTAPAADAMPSQLHLAFASCQHWEFGHYAAHRHIASMAPDLVVFLGDYIYEWGPYQVSHPATPTGRDIESFTLAEYRMRYAQYKSDPHLQAAHRAAPWIVTWDDHEVANDYADTRDERLATNFLTRRAAAYQAFYEHMPVRLPPLPSGSDRFAYMRLYERYDWGRLACFHVLDNRQYRAHQACSRPDFGGSSSIVSTCAERLDPTRSLLGKTQEKWLADGFEHSKARWNIVAQQTLMAQSSQVAIHGPDDGRFWNDGWDGYPAARDRLFEDIVRHRPANPVVISGDVHTFYAANLKRDFLRPASARNPVIATEFCGTSVTSSSRPQARTERYLEYNPHIRYGRSDRRGFVAMDLAPGKMQVRFLGLDDVDRPDSALATLARFDVEDGRPGVVRTG